MQVDDKAVAEILLTLTHVFMWVAAGGGIVWIVCSVIRWFLPPEHSVGATVQLYGVPDEEVPAFLQDHPDALPEAQVLGVIRSRRKLELLAGVMDEADAMKARIRGCVVYGIIR